MTEGNLIGPPCTMTSRHNMPILDPWSQDPAEMEAKAEVVSKRVIVYCAFDQYYRK